MAGAGLDLLNTPTYINALVLLLFIALAELIEWVRDSRCCSQSKCGLL